MLFPKSTHEQYQNYLLSFVNKVYIDTNDLINVHKYSKQLISFFISDFSTLYSSIKHAYTCSSAGSPLKNPVPIFRSLILMVYLGFTSIDKRVLELRTVKILAIISGFLPWKYEANNDEEYIPDSIPGVGTFYDFMKRLVITDKLLHKSHYRKPKKKKRKKKKKKKKKKKSKTKLKKGEKLNNTRVGFIDRISKRVINMGDSKLQETMESLINSILKELFVLPSVKLNIMCNPSKFNIAGDSTNVVTAANSYGHSTCDCKLNGINNCNCVRKYSDPNANWGWDSSDEYYFYGHVFHHFTAADSPNDLPIIIKPVSAKRFDGVTGVFAIKELVDLYPELDFYSASFDKAYDAIGFYRLLTNYHIAPIIDINDRHKEALPLPKSFDADGYFICPSNYRMIKHGVDWTRRRHKNRCPHAVSPEKYPCNNNCSDKPFSDKLEKQKLFSKFAPL